MIFKKQISLFLVFTLLISQLGIAITVHYCDNEIASISLKKEIAVEKNCCGEVEKQSNCCRNKIIKIDFKPEQNLSKSISFSSEYILISKSWKPLFIVSKNNQISRKNTSYSCNANAPPSYILFHRLVFYA